MGVIAATRRVPVQSFLVALTILFTLVLGGLAGYGAGRIDSRPVVSATAPRAAVTIDPQSPDTQDLIERQLTSQGESSTHGH